MLLTVDDVTRRSHYRNAYRTFGRLLELGVVPVVNENDTVATHEIRFGDNDRLAALVAHLVHADALVLLSDVDSLYTGHPKLPDSRRISDVRGEADLVGVDVSRRGSAVGTGGMVTKIEAARIATSAGIPVVLTSADHVAAALAGDAGRHLLPSDRQAPADPAALARACQRRPRRAVSGRGRGPCGGRAQGVAAAGRHHGGDRRLSRSASRSTWSRRTAGGRPRPGELRLRGAADPARPDHPRAHRGARGRATTGPPCTATPWSSSRPDPPHSSPRIASVAARSFTSELGANCTFSGREPQIRAHFRRNEAVG